MAEPRLIRDYRAALAKRLPDEIVEELTDGLEQTYQRHLSTGLAPHDAAHAAISEFGDADTLTALFAAGSPARRAALALLYTGPLVGGCWATLLITTRAWDWPVPVPVRSGLALLLGTVILLLAFTACTASYRRARHTATAACAGLIALDATLGTALLVPSAAHGWLLMLAAAGAARITFSARALRRIHAH